MPDPLHHSDIERRLDALDEKLDRVSEAMLTLVRVEERQIQTAQTLDRLWKTIESHETRLSQVEKTHFNTFTKQAMWGLIVLLVGVIGYLVPK